MTVGHSQEGVEAGNDMHKKGNDHNVNKCTFAFTFTAVKLSTATVALCTVPKTWLPVDWDQLSGSMCTWHKEGLFPENGTPFSQNYIRGFFMHILTAWARLSASMKDIKH